ncbi:hypothetical protein F2Q69_00055568, partial [Brassica cretica]
MATSGTYVTEVPLKGSAEKHYKRWKTENHLFPDAIGHHIQGVTVHDGEWDSHGSIKIWNYTCDGKQEVFKERRENDDENMAVTLRGLEEKPLRIFLEKFQYHPADRVSNPQPLAVVCENPFSTAVRPPE